MGPAGRKLHKIYVYKYNTKYILRIIYIYHICKYEYKIQDQFGGLSSGWDQVGGGSGFQAGEQGHELWH